MTVLLYGFDALCGWCYGIVPAMRRVAADHPGIPIRLVMAGLLTDEGVGPYADMEGFIRCASRHLKDVTGRSPSEAYFRRVSASGAEANSGPPSVAIAHVAGLLPDRAVDFAHRVIEAHFEDGADLGDPGTYAPMLAELGLPPDLPDIHDARLAEAVWAEGRRIGLRAFPTLALVKDGRARVLPLDYDPERLSELVAKAAK